MNSRRDGSEGSSDAKLGKQTRRQIALALLASLLPVCLVAGVLLVAAVKASLPCVSPPEGTWPPPAARTYTYVDLPHTAAEMRRATPNPGKEPVIVAVYKTPGGKRVQVWPLYAEHPDPGASLNEKLRRSGSRTVMTRFRTKVVDECPDGIVAMPTTPLGGAAACYPTRFIEPKTYIDKPGAVCIFFDRWSGAELEAPGMTVSELAGLMSRLRPAVQVPRTL
ncbi:hypothetical protein [Microbispora sp. H10949]|uniref:hypothetical protein n=1 Tax=Microbispora sp. H10949 TaxID=2729111 RepID=UPI001602E176|nr:hypothetical protein [Microbispora sp. H10949]